MTDEQLHAADEQEPAVVDDGTSAFWQAARGHLGLGKFEVVVGGTPKDVVPPPSFSFGDSPALADELLGLVLAGRKRATATAWSEFGEERPPQVGDLSIVLDGAGTPSALIRTTRTETVPFDEVTDEFAAAEGEGDATLASWRADHERYWRRVLGDDGFAPTMPVFCEWFELVYPTDGPTPPVD